MRAIWKGAVSFGLVNVPVRLYAATQEHDIRFHQVHRDDGGRIRMKRICSVCGEEVAYDQLAKGYETDDGGSSCSTDEDFEALPLATEREIDVVEFVPADQVDPILFGRTYYLEPEARAAKPYALLREALETTDRMAVVKVALRQRESLAVLRVRDRVIVLQTLLWPDEVRAADFPILDERRRAAPAGAADGGVAGREPGRRLRAGPVRGRLPEGPRRPGRGQAGGRRPGPGRRPPRPPAPRSSTCSPPCSAASSAPAPPAARTPRTSPRPVRPWPRRPPRRPRPRRLRRRPPPRRPPPRLRRRLRPRKPQPRPPRRRPHPRSPPPAARPDRRAISSGAFRARCSHDAPGRHRDRAKIGGSGE